MVKIVKTIKRLPRKLKHLLALIYVQTLGFAQWGSKRGTCLNVRLAALTGQRVKMALDLTVHGQRLVYLSGMREEQVTNLFCQLVTKYGNTSQGATIVDVGAYIGYYTVIASKLVGEKGKVLAFEPAPDNFSLLRKTVDVNRLENVTLYQKAVSDKIGKIDFWLSSDPATHSLGNAINGFFIKNHRQTGEIIEVDTITLDEIIREKELPCENLIVKIDVEGAELKALQGMQKTLIDGKNLHLICEVHEQKFPTFGYTPRDFFQYLHKYQLDLYLIGEQLIPIEESPPDLRQYEIYARKH